MKNITITFVVVASFCLLQGCRWFQSIPDGEIGDGPIVQYPRMDRKFSEQRGVNFMTTSLTASLIRKFTPGATLHLNANFKSDDEEYKELPVMVMHKIRDLYILKYSDSSPYMIKSEVKNIKSIPDCALWTMSLIDEDNKVIWTEQILIK